MQKKGGERKMAMEFTGKNGYAWKKTRRTYTQKRWKHISDQLGAEINTRECISIRHQKKGMQKNSNEEGEEVLGRMG